MKNVTSFEISGQTIKRFFYDSPAAGACSACGLITDPDWTNKEFEVDSCHLDFGYTYDFATIVSDRFAATVRAWPGVKLEKIAGSMNWFHLTCDQVVAYDKARGNVQLLRPCDECGRFREIFAPFLACLAPEVLVPGGLARTDQVFGSASDSPSEKRAQIPTLIVDAEHAVSLRSGGFKGLVLRPVGCGPVTGS
jgi:hypothetical protein